MKPEAWSQGHPKHRPPPEGGGLFDINKRAKPRQGGIVHCKRGCTQGYVMRGSRCEAPAGGLVPPCDGLLGGERYPLRVVDGFGTITALTRGENELFGS